jgi:hypothetical protein
MAKRLLFGVFPGSGVGVNSGSGIILGPVDDPQKILKALDYLHGNKPFIVRGYLHYNGFGKSSNITPENMKQYTNGNRKLDLVICYRCEKYNKNDWIEFIEKTIVEYGSCLSKIQITEEPNNLDPTTGGDGGFPNVIDALVDGIIVAKEIIKNKNFSIEIGFNCVPSFNPEDNFWNAITQKNSLFINALDYIGFDFYPGVFRPLPPAITYKDAISGLLGNFRNTILKKAKIPSSVPIHITENGWPTNEERDEIQQDTVVKDIIQTIIAIKDELNITCYEFFLLRDDNNSKPGFKFGLLKDNYEPKKIFETFKKIIEKESL